MKKMALMFDSSCGLTEKEINKLGGFFIPILVSMDGKTYKTGIDLDSDYMEEHMTVTSKPKTAAATLGDLRNVYDKALETYEKVFYLSLSRHISSTNDTARALSKDEKFNGKIFVYPSNFITPWIQFIIKDIFHKVNNENYDEVKLAKWLDKINNQMYGWLVPTTLKYLYAGGRISKIQYAMGNLLKIHPIVPASNGSINKGVDKARSLEKSYDKIINLNLEKAKTFDGPVRFAVGSDHKHNHVEELLTRFEKHGIDRKDIYIARFASEIIAHVGPEYYFAGLIPVVK